jgi:TolB-like protein/Tfp pilus assembly protein PilF
MNPRNFFAELKRRNVYKVAVAYAIVSWLLIQAASILFPTFEAPPWVMKVFVVVIVLGFPVALILAWAFELTPEGIKRAEDVAPNESITRNTGRKLTVIIVAVAVLATALLVFQFTRSSGTKAKPNSVPSASDKSIAVLPFENLSSDKENAFFAQGIQDEIITTLSRIGGLRVISRTSTARYKSVPENLPEIARELRVSNILEGSVQKSGDRVHINVQLIQAETDVHLWAQSYDRQLIDIFSVEGEVAKSIADSLRTTLSPQEKARVESRPTNNADAYVLYLQARNYQSRPDILLENFQNAAQFYEQAIALDPNFALAHARLSANHSAIYHWFEPTDTRKRKARSEAEQALRLEPNLGEGHLALGLCSYYGDVDYERALHELDLAARALPNDGDVGLYIAAVRRRQGRWTDSIVAYQNAERNDPRNSPMLYDFSQTYFALRDWRAAAQALDRVLALAPDSITVKIQRAYIEFFSKGNTAPIRAALQSISANIDPDGIVSFARWDVALMDRDAGAAGRTVESCRLESITSPSGVPLPKSYLQACTDLMRGDTARAQPGFEAARPAFEIMVANSPKDAPRHAHLGLLYAFMGRKEDALTEAQRAVELKPISRDAVDGAELQAILALIYTRIGEPDQAIPLIEHLLTTPAALNYSYDSITISDLRTRWEWDPLRNDARFQKLIAAPEPKTVYK